jgi:hypothetical protein
MKDKKTIKREILDQFREIDAGRGDELSPAWLEDVYLKQLRRPERKLYHVAVKELAAMGIVEKESGDDLRLRLTLKGEKLLDAGASRRPGALRDADPPLFGFTGTDG